MYVAVCYVNIISATKTLLLSLAFTVQVLLPHKFVGKPKIL